MSTIIKQCKDLCREKVMSVGHCEKCGKSLAEQHHGIFKSNQRAKLNPLLLLDPDLQFALCPECHRTDPDSPHMDNVAFLDCMIAQGGETAYKAQRIIDTCEGPCEKVSTRDIDYKQIRRRLSA